MSVNTRAPGSISGRMGAAWSRQGADYRARREAALRSPSASTQEAVTAPSREAFAAAITAQQCPYCGAGPYDNLGMHTNRAHGVSASELRELSGLTRVCSERLSEDSRDRLIARPDRDEISRRGAEASALVGSQGKATAAHVARYEELLREWEPELTRRAMEGEPLTDIATAFGVALPTVTRALDRLGVRPTLARTNADRRARLEANRARAREALEASQARERGARVARFAELGGDWLAVGALAEELGSSEKHIRAYLRAAGAVVPDGHLVSHRRGGPRPAMRGRSNTSARAATPAVVAQIKALSAAGVSQRQISAEVGVGQSTISRILSGRYVGEA